MARDRRTGFRRQRASIQGDVAPQRQSQASQTTLQPYGGRAGGGTHTDAGQAQHHAARAVEAHKRGDTGEARRAHGEAAYFHRQAADAARQLGSQSAADMHEHHAEHHRQAAHGHGTGSKPRMGPNHAKAGHEHNGLAQQHGLRHGAPTHHTSASTGGRAPEHHPDGIKRDDHGRFARK